MRETAESTICSVSIMFTFQLKNRSTSADPRLVTERTDSSPGTPLTACSIGRVMVTSICSIGMTPLSRLRLGITLGEAHKSLAEFNASLAEANDEDDERFRIVREMHEREE